MRQKVIKIIREILRIRLIQLRRRLIKQKWKTEINKRLRAKRGKKNKKKERFLGTKTLTQSIASLARGVSIQQSSPFYGVSSCRSNSNTNKQTLNLL